MVSGMTAGPAFAGLFLAKRARSHLPSKSKGVAEQKQVGYCSAKQGGIASA
jgi:hypothetical protein